MIQRSAIGILIISLGMLYFLKALGIDTELDVTKFFWPILMMAFGLSGLFEKNKNHSLSAIIFTLGFLLSLEKLGLLGEFYTWELIWPIVLIALGIKVMFPRRESKSEVHNFKKQGNTVSNSELNETVIFSGSALKNNATEFKGGVLTTVFGGLELDLRDANILEGEDIYIEVSAIFGGATIFVPKDWNVKLNVTPLFGGVDNKTTHEKEGQKILTITGIVVFGGLEVRN